MTVKITPRKKLFVDAAVELFGDGAIISKQNVREAAEKAGVPFPTWFMKPEFKVHYGSYKLPGETSTSTVVASATTTTDTESLNIMNLVASNAYIENLVPAKFEGFVEWGHFGTLTKIIKSNLFYPVFITGLSGNGKTLMVEQIHAKFNKELIDMLYIYGNFGKKTLNFFPVK